MSPVAEPHPRTTFLGLNTTHLRQRLFLWLIVHLGIRDCSPRQLLRFWWIGGGTVALGPGTIGVLSTARGDPLAWLFLAIVVGILVVGIVVGGAAAADLRSPVTIEGRVTAFRRLMVKGIEAHNSDRYQYRVTLDEGTGDERIFRAADETNLSLSEGDAVRARVGMRLRWIYDIEMLDRDPA
jgi:hypothetical protein